MNNPLFIEGIPEADTRELTYRRFFPGTGSSLVIPFFAGSPSRGNGFLAFLRAPDGIVRGGWTKSRVQPRGMPTAVHVDGTNRLRANRRRRKRKSYSGIRPSFTKPETGLVSGRPGATVFRWSNERTVISAPRRLCSIAPVPSIASIGGLDRLVGVVR